jgi:hypothetical protein
VISWFQILLANSTCTTTAGVQVAWDEEANTLLEGVRAMREGGEPSLEAAGALGRLLRQVQISAVSGGAGAAAFGVGGAAAPQPPGANYMFAGGVHVPPGAAGQFYAQQWQQPISYAPSGGLSGGGGGGGSIPSAAAEAASAATAGRATTGTTSTPGGKAPSAAATAAAAMALAGVTPARAKPMYAAADADWTAYLGGSGSYPGVDLNISRQSLNQSTEAQQQQGGQNSAGFDTHQQQYREWEVPPQLQAAFAGAPPVPAHAAWATSLQQRSVDGLLRAQVAALRLRLRTAVRRTEATRYHSSRGGVGVGVGGGLGAPQRPSSATAATTTF